MFQPTTFGKYFLTRRLAVGGMAEVFQAKLYGADGFEKDLVIKQILPQYARDPEFVQSFVAEAKIAVTLTHANVVGIYELGRVDGTYFIAMEYVDGLDVFSLIDAAERHGREISIGWSLLVAEEVAKGLDYAHRKVGPDHKPLGLVHRDLNPRNVLISTEGDVKILDFGIAKTASTVAAMPKTRAGVVKGTSGYMSPEQATGREIDHRTDIYQAGLLLFEMLTGQALFWRPDDQETRELMRRHRVIPPSSLAPEVPPEVDAIVLRCLERNPDARYQTGDDVATDIARIRYTRYADADHRALGSFVAELARKEAVTEEVAAQALPSTEDLSNVISRAIEQTVTGQVETIATRAPSNVIVPKPPTTGSVPLMVEPAPVTAEPERPAAAPATGQPGALASEPSLEQLVEPPVSRLPRQKPLAAIVAGVAAFALIGGGVVAFVPKPEPVVEVALPRKPEVELAQAADAGLRAVQPPPAPELEPSPEKPVKPVKRDKPPRRRRPKRPPRRAKPEEGFGVVAFGTRSCSSRVTVDGQVVTRSTPFYGHKLPAGRHRVVLEGTSCPPIERPGSLRRSIPVVATTIQVKRGASLKVIADFDHERVIVRRQ